MATHPTVDLSTLFMAKTKQIKNQNAPPKQKQKPGNKGDFHGKRYDFPVANLDVYLAASREGHTRKFWPDLFENYWARFYWRLALNEEPEDENGGAVSEVLTKEDEDEKARIQKSIKGVSFPQSSSCGPAAKHKVQKIKTWYNHHRGAMGLTNNPYTPWLARLRRPDQVCPKRVTDYQYYMQHDDYKEAVQNEFKTRHWDRPHNEHLALRCKVVCEFFEAEPEDVKDRIRLDAREEHEEEVARWRDAEDGLPSTNEEEQQEARVRFSAVVSPLLVALKVYTGYDMTLIAGRIVDDGGGAGNEKYDILNIHVGRMKSKDGQEGADIMQWDPEGYKGSFLRQFALFLRAKANESDSPTSPPNQPSPPGPAAAAAGSPSVNRNPENTAPPSSPGPAAAAAGSPSANPNPENNAPAGPLPPLEQDDKEMPDNLLPCGADAAPPPPPSGTPLQQRQGTPVPRSLEERMATLSGLGSPLRREIEVMAVERREQRMGELECMSKLKLVPRTT
ncbi:hypothetical protein B0H16DRAFT_1722345 [Mycena metata]|uniref:Uncharacterized protein n=1 Tax=Mycena metata TaxID=1033252 RepID=A0AAD7ND04_9AGAR|nr:hypothetical protein B0H16DRAFT_1722345 [Mycena metata]